MERAIRLESRGLIPARGWVTPGDNCEATQAGPQADTKQWNRWPTTQKPQMREFSLNFLN